MSFLEHMFYNGIIRKIYHMEEVLYDREREKLITSIIRLLSEIDDARLRCVYQFVLHISK